MNEAFESRGKCAESLSGVLGNRLTSRPQITACPITATSRWTSAAVRNPLRSGVRKLMRVALSTDVRTSPLSWF
jgi:hypothetical protein